MLIYRMKMLIIESRLDLIFSWRVRIEKNFDKNIDL